MDASQQNGLCPHRLRPVGADGSTVDGVGRSRRERAPGSGNDGVDARGSVHQMMKRELLNVLCRVFGRFRRLVCMRAYRSGCEWALDLASCHERNRTPKVGGERELDPGPW